MKCFILHSCFAIFFLIAWKGFFDFHHHVRQDIKLAPLVELTPRFLTNWTFIGLTLLCLGYLINDVLRVTNSLVDFEPKMKRKLDFLFYSIIGPMCIFVPVVFWGLYLSDEDLINSFPEARIDQIIPPWVNHSVHTVVAVVVISHAYLNRVSSFHLKTLLPPIAAYFLIYIVCIYATYYQKDVWVYGFLKKLHEPFRLISLLFLTTLTVIIGFVFNCVNNWHCNKPAKFLWSKRSKDGPQQKTIRRISDFIQSRFPRE